MFPIKQLFLAIMLGLIATVAVMQQSQWVRESVGIPIAHILESSLDCKISAKVASVQFLYPAVEFADVVVTPKQGLDWTWRAERFMLKTSWWDIITKHQIFLQVFLDGANAFSKIENSEICIWRFIDKLLNGEPAVPITLQSLAITGARSRMVHDGLQGQAEFLFDCETRQLDGSYKTVVTLHSGSAHVRDRCCFEAVQGSTSIVPQVKGGVWQLVYNTKCSFQVPALAPYHTCYASMLIEGPQGTCTIKNGDQAIDSTPFRFSWGHKEPFDKTQDRKKSEILMQLPVHFAERLLMNNMQAHDCGGVFVAHAQADTQDENSWRGNVHISHLKYRDQLVSRIGMLSFITDFNHLRGAAYLDHDFLKLSGPWQLDVTTGVAQAMLTNAAEITVPEISSYQIGAKKLQALLNFVPSQGVKLSYQGTIHDVAHVAVAHACRGHCLFDGSELEIGGSVADINYDARMDLSLAQLRTMHIKNSSGESLVEMRSHPDHGDRFEGVINLALASHIARQWFNTELQTEGSINVQGLLKDGNVFGSLQLQGAARIPSTYHVLSQAHARFIIEPGTKKCVLKDMLCSFNRGQIVCPRATVLFDDAYKLQFVHIPLQISNFFVSSGSKDLFASISANLLCTYMQQTPAISGSIIIERGQLKNTSLFDQNSFNFFNAGSAHEESNMDVALDINVATHEPVRIKTILVESNAKIDLTCKGSISKPILDGSIEFFSGLLKLPYKPLLITKGSAYFLPNQPLDPMIELVAKNKIRQYNVALRISGSLSQPHIMLDASPSLTEEQVLGLLLVGSEEHSLSTMVPALIVQNLKNLIISPDQSPINLEAYWAHLLRPLKYIHIMPSFTDQAGRGGLRGGIEIEVGDRCRASVQKNFDLTEDIRGEIEYLLSDDIRLKGIRDERGDMSAEVEMRWKF